MRIGVDLGGTNVRAGLVKDGRIVRLLSEPCKADRPEGEVVDHIASLIGSLMRPEVSRMAVPDSKGAPRVANEFSKCGMPWLIRVRSMVPSIQRGRMMPS